MEKFRREIESAAEPRPEEERARVRGEFLEDLREGRLAVFSEEELLKNSNFDKDFVGGPEVKKAGLEGVNRLFSSLNSNNILKNLTAVENIKYVLELPEEKVQEIAKKSFIKNIDEHQFDNALLIINNFSIDQSILNESYIIRAFRRYLTKATSAFRNNPDELIRGVNNLMMLLKSSEGLKRDKNLYSTLAKIAIVFSKRATFEQMHAFMKWLPDLKVFIENSEELQNAAIGNFKNIIEDGANTEADLKKAIAFINLFNFPKDFVDGVVESVIGKKLENGELIYAIELADIFSYPVQKLENRVKRLLIDVLDGRIDYKGAPDLPEEVAERFGHFINDVDVIIAAKKFVKKVREDDASLSRRYRKIFLLDDAWKSQDIEELRDEYKDALMNLDWETAIEIKETNRLDEAFIKDQAFRPMYENCFKEVLKEFIKFENVDLTDDDFDNNNPATVSDKLNRIAGSFELPEDFIIETVMNFAESQARAGNMETFDLLRMFFSIDMDNAQIKEAVSKGLLKSIEKGSTIFRKFELNRSFIDSEEFQEAINQFSKINLSEGNVDPLIYFLKEKLNFPLEFFRKPEFKKAALVALQTLMESEIIYSEGDEDDEDEIVNFHRERISKTIELFDISNEDVAKIAEECFTNFLNDNNTAGAKEIYRRFPFSREGYAISEVKRALSRLLNAEDKEAKSIRQIEFLFKSFKPLKEIFTYPDIQREATRKMLEYKAAGHSAAAEKIRKMFELK